MAKTTPVIEPKATIRRAQDAPSNWFQRIGSWFAFVKGRRLDLRFPVWPPRRVTTAFCAAAMLTILMMLLVDRKFLALVRSGATDNHTFFELITYIGKSDWILYLSGLVILVFTVFTADRFGGKLHRVWHRLFLTAYFVFTSVAFSGLITMWLEICFRPVASAIGRWGIALGGSAVHRRV